MPVDLGVSREQVTWRNSSGWAVSCPAARKLLRSSCWASASLAISSAWRTSEALTRSLPRWTNSAIETKQRTLQVARLAKPPLAASSSTWSVRNAHFLFLSFRCFQKAGVRSSSESLVILRDPSLAHSRPRVQSNMQGFHPDPDLERNKRAFSWRKEYMCMGDGRRGHREGQVTQDRGPESAGRQ